MPLASSGSVNLTTVRDYYGSSSNNLTALYKGGSFVPNPTSYNSGTQTTNAANANSNVPTSGSISLTDFRGGRKLVTNAAVTVDASGITESGDTGDRQWVGVKTNSDYWYRSGYNVNYAGIAGVANQAQLLFVNRWSLAGQTCSFSIPFTVNVAGEYYLHAVVSGPGGAGATLNFTGSGVSSGGVTNQSMGSGTTQVLTPVLTASTTVTVSMTSGTSGGAGDNISIYFRTNCNADASNIGGNAGNNYSLM